jgi:PQQ-like domain
MKKLLCAVVGVLFVASTGSSQDQVREYTSPKLPPRDVLDRLSLKMAWHLKLRTDGKRDGFVSVQVIPGPKPSKDRAQLLVQTFYGSVILLDSETGDILWRTDTGDDPYAPGHPAGAYLSHSIFVVRKNIMYVLNRANGLHRAFVYEKGSKLPLIGFPMHSVPSAGMVASARADYTEPDRVFVPMENKLVAYHLPAYDIVDVPLDEGIDFETRERVRRRLMPDVGWSLVLPSYSFQHRPLVGSRSVALTASNGTFFSFERRLGKVGADYRFRRPVSGAMAQRMEVVYIPCEDGTLYAMSIDGRLNWRYLSGSPISRKPEATDQDVFVSPDRMGLVCLNVDTGRERWINKGLDRFLGTNFKFVYAADRHGQLHILDHARGTEMAKYDMSGFNVPITNDLTDRLYFASHDGQIICLHHKDNRQPLRTKQVPDYPDTTRKKKDLDKKPPDKKVDLLDPPRVPDVGLQRLLTATPLLDRREPAIFEPLRSASRQGARG